MTTSFAIPDDTVDSDKEWYYGSYEWLYLYKYYSVNIQEYQIGMDSDLDELDMEDVLVDYGRERHWRI